MPFDILAKIDDDKKIRIRSRNKSFNIPLKREPINKYSETISEIPLPPIDFLIPPPPTENSVIMNDVVSPPENNVIMSETVSVPEENMVATTEIVSPPEENIVVSDEIFSPLENIPSDDIIYNALRGLI